MPNEFMDSVHFLYRNPQAGPFSYGCQLDNMLGCHASSGHGGPLRWSNPEVEYAANLIKQAAPPRDLEGIKNGIIFNRKEGKFDVLRSKN